MEYVGERKFVDVPSSPEKLAVIARFEEYTGWRSVTLLVCGQRCQFMFKFDEADTVFTQGHSIGSSTKSRRGFAIIGHKGWWYDSYGRAVQAFGWEHRDLLDNLASALRWVI